jgi:hypothetical protein
LLSIQNSFDLHLPSANAVGFIPMYFSMADFTVWELYSCHAFEFPPTTPTEPIFQDLPLPDRQVGSYKLDVLNMAEELEIHLVDSNLTPDELGRTFEGLVV